MPQTGGEVDFLKYSCGESRWHDKGGREPGDVRGAITSSACGSSVCWQRAHRSREPLENSPIDYHALRRHWRNHVSAEARAAHIAGAGASKDQLEEIVADESLALIDHYRIVRGALYKGFGAASELGDGNSLALLAALRDLDATSASAPALMDRRGGGAAVDG